MSSIELVAAKPELMDHAIEIGGKAVEFLQCIDGFLGPLLFWVASCEMRKADFEISPEAAVCSVAFDAIN
jgi:hypothetical protein